MKATSNIHKAETINSTATRFDDKDGTNTAQAPEMQAGAAEQGRTGGKPESELRAAARRHGINLKELAVKMGVNYGYLSSVASGRRPWTPLLRERATAVLGEVPGQGVVYRQGGLVQGESTCIRERARELGLTQKELAQRVGGVRRLHVGRVPGAPEHEPGGPSAGRVGAGRPGEGRACRVRQPPGRSGERERAEQLHPGAGPRAGA